MLKKEDYIKTVRRPYTPFQCSLFMTALKDAYYYKPFITESIYHKDIIKVDHVWYYSKRDIDDMAEIIYKEWMDGDSLNRTKQALVKQEKRLLDSTGDINIFAKEMIAYSPAISLVFVEDELVSRKIKKMFLAKLTESDTKDILDKINIPLEINYYKQEEYDLIRCKDIEKHVKKYEWINSRYGQYIPYTVEEAKYKLSHINKDKFLQAWQETQNNTKQAIVKAKSILGEEDRMIVDIMQFIIFYRTHRSDNINRALYYIIPEIERIAKEKNLTYEEAQHCMEDELFGNLPSKEILQKRIEEHAFVVENKKMTCLVGKELQKVKNEMCEKFDDVDEFKGTVARRGIVQGKVKIVLGRQDIGKVGVGDILVASMTTPEVLPAMKKAAAFVTDEGGITCHAAIISREMKKPCVIGTRIATQVLKDGDIVEVDAEKGIVKKLNNK